MSTGHYDCQICNPRDQIVTFDRQLLVFGVVLSSLSVNCMSRFLGLDVVLGPTLSIECLSINLRISSLVIFIYLQDRYVEIHF